MHRHERANANANCDCKAIRMRANASPVGRCKSRRARTSCPLGRDWALGIQEGVPPREHIADLKQKGPLRPIRMMRRWALTPAAETKDGVTAGRPKGSEGKHAPGIHPPSSHLVNRVSAAEEPPHLRFKAHTGGVTVKGHGVDGCQQGIATRPSVPSHRVSNALTFIIVASQTHTF